LRPQNRFHISSSSYDAVSLFYLELYVKLSIYLSMSSSNTFEWFLSAVVQLCEGAH
jgi:hypothetical protein